MSDQPRCRDLYLKTHSTHNRQTSIFPAGFEPEIPGNERPQTHSWDRLFCCFAITKYPTPIVRESLGAGLDGTENFASTRILFPDLPTRSEPPHRLLYPGRQYSDVQCLNSSPFINNNF